MSVEQTLSGSFSVKSDAVNGLSLDYLSYSLIRVTWKWFDGIWSDEIIAISQNPLQKRLQRYLDSNKIEFLFLAKNLDPILVSEIFLGFIPVDYFVRTSGEWLKKDSVINIKFSETFFAKKVFFNLVWFKGCIWTFYERSITFSGCLKCFDKLQIMIIE